MFELKLFAGLVAVYLLLGIRSYRRRRAEAGGRGTPFALRELGEAVWMSVLWFAWPFGPPGDPREGESRPSGS